ncbi:hypothetical protein [Sphingomonas sp. Leaf231]|uniref:hypothetical protein n=1 Tax=Sphingomonas sp. Leaf231 TaxID=1736301 RepID=UPI0012E12EED|nr:hypothetical protein [Sphingomonas sp. Leaf231]
MNYRARCFLFSDYLPAEFIAVRRKLLLSSSLLLAMPDWLRHGKIGFHHAGMYRCRFCTAMKRSAPALPRADRGCRHGGMGIVRD